MFKESEIVKSSNDMATETVVHEKYTSQQIILDNNDLTKKVEVKTRSCEQQTDAIVRRSKTQIRKNTKWTSTDMFKESEIVKSSNDMATETVVHEKYTQTSKSTKHKSQQTDNVKQIISTKPKIKNASTDTLKYQKTKSHQTDSLSNQKTILSSQKCKFQQTDDFLFINLNGEIKSTIQKIDSDAKTKSKVESFINKLSKLMPLREVNCVLSPEIRIQMAEEFVQKVIKLTNIDAIEITPITDKKSTEEITQNSFSEKKLKTSVLIPFFDEAQSVQHSPRHKQLLNRIDEVRKEIKQESEYRQQDAANELTEVSAEHEGLSRLIHQIVTYMCTTHNVDPVKVSKNCPFLISFTL
jgi:hypothetical protein